MYQMKIYTLRTAEALQQYATVHWPRHLGSMPSFGVTVHGFWTDHEAGAHRLIRPRGSMEPWLSVRRIKERPARAR